MADISDVEVAMVQVIAGFLGTAAPYLPTSVASAASVGTNIRIGRGWPLAKQLDTDLCAGIATVTVFPITGMVRHSLKYMFKWHQGATVTAPTLTAAVAGATVTFSGAGGAGQIAGVAIGSGPSRAAYAVRLADADTPATVAAGLAAKIPNASANGAVLTLQTNLPVTARVAADQPEWLETRRQDQGVWVMTWCSTPQVRDLVARTIDEGFANMQDQFGRQTEFFGLPDGSNAWVKYAGSVTDDRPQQANLYRRNLRYVIQYPTTLVETQPEVLFPGGPLWTNGTLNSFGDVEPSDSASP